MIRKSTEILLKDAIEAWLKTNHFDTKLNETRLVSSWEKVTGKLIARHTENLFIKNRELFVKVDSSALKHELTYMKTKLLKKLNKAVGAEVIDEIKFI
jgi:predicted nucleic acid-binding Zn ribbon protein